MRCLRQPCLRGRPPLQRRCLQSGPFSAKRSIDVHTHMYFPRYMQMLRERQQVPRVTGGASAAQPERLIILPGEDEEGSTSAGRPIGSEYFDVDVKLRFMDRHGISASVVSLANPWLDFLTAQEASKLASELNDDLQEMCEASRGRLFGFGVVAAQQPRTAAKEVERMMRELPLIKGIILGSTGAGKGLDDPELDPLFAACEATGCMIFLHPHYGVGTEHFSGTGHSLFLGLGFPFETTTAAARLIVSGTLDTFPGLKLLLAHSGGTLPFLAGRLDSCVAHDLAISQRLEHAPSDYLRRMYFDSTIYHEPGLKALLSLVDHERVMYGTDNPFFPPMNEATNNFDPHADADWPSTVRTRLQLGVGREERRAPARGTHPQDMLLRASTFNLARCPKRSIR
eukprot:scaffold3100_cov248-Pinguiococcus_pyrenoidosus.AAC.16